MYHTLATTFDEKTNSIKNISTPVTVDGDSYLRRWATNWCQGSRLAAALGKSSIWEQLLPFHDPGEPEGDQADSFYPIRKVVDVSPVDEIDQ